MRSLFFTRILVAYSIIVLALFSVSFYFASRSVRTYHLDAVTKGLGGVNAIMCREILPCLGTAPTKELDAYVRHVGALTQKRITVIAMDGKVLADSEIEAARMENHGGRPEVADALRGRVGCSLRMSDTLKEQMLYVAAPVLRDGSVVAAVRSSEHVATLDMFLGRLRGSMLCSALVVTLLALAAVFIVSRKWSRPVEALVQAARNVAGGNLDTKVYVDTRDETAVLAMSFNDMVARVKQSVDALARQKDELAALIAALREGLLVVQLDGKAAMVNASFSALTGIAVKEGANYWESIRTPAVMELVERVLAERRHVHVDTEINGRQLVCNAEFIAQSGRAIITVHDVTEIAATAKMKREFVSNVSHELRTPLTSIKGFAETMLDGAQPEARRHIEVIVRNTERLINIVEDLLRLSDLERESFRLDLADTDVVDVLASVAKSLEKRFAEKGIMLVLEMPSAPLVVKADVFRLEQVFVNLLDNAAKYTDQGRVVVAARVGESGGAVVSVRDTGVGIPARNLPHIFERFYVVDKSRSRKLGGTGLGLAIVKHIVLLHHGTVAVESEEGKGSTFTVTLPGVVGS